QVGLMPDELDKALRNCTFSKVVQQEVDGAHAVGITAVPTFVIGNRGIVGVQSYDVFKFVMSSLDKE
ncbi:MAG: DsbA family protein, partial [Dehalococcoidia bacterium]|nr:DsbA family protein [Dehalococcoidia bacterium]